MNFKEIWNNIKNFFVSNVWNIVGFFALLIIGIIVIKIALNITKKMMSKTKMELVTQSFLYKIIKFVLYFILLIILLNSVGVSMTGVVTAFSAILLAVGMALQSNISNLANGIVIVSSKLFKKGDFIEVGGVSGSITDINFLYTTITTGDNKKVTLPNSTIVNNPLTNYGANTTRRIDFTFSVAYESDVELVKKVINDVIYSNGKVIIDEKKPFCRLKTLAASSLDFFVNCWVDAEDYWDVYYYIVENVYNEFKRNNISVPYNQLEIRERKDNVKLPINQEKLPERVQKERKVAKKSIDLENDDLVGNFVSLMKRQKTKFDTKKAIKKANKANHEHSAESTTTDSGNAQ